MSLTSRLLVFLPLFVAASAHAQYVQVSTNPASLIFGVFKLEAEVPIGKGFAIEPEVSLFVKGQRFWSLDYNSEGERFGLVVKKYLDLSKPYEGLYGFMYGRFGDIAYTDFQEEGEERDQRDFERQRNTIGFGIGHTRVGKDGFYYGFALGIGRHYVNEKTYSTPPLRPNGLVYETNDAELISLPLDVYARISVGVRLFSEKGRQQKSAFEKAQELERAAERERLQRTLDEYQQRREQLLQGQ